MNRRNIPEAERNGKREQDPEPPSVAPSASRAEDVRVQEWEDVAFQGDTALPLMESEQLSSDINSRWV